MGTVEDLEIQRRSLAMLAPGAPGLKREAAIELIEQRRRSAGSSSWSGMLRR